ncbi:MAG: hypothetical protein HZA52_01075 [Planctomycetes bacterium]|nr:hypothetical protein [Planctomycetota bacterium]
MSSSPLSIDPEDRVAARDSGKLSVVVLVILMACLLWGIVVARVNFDRTWGWDESMHAELPAARLVELAKRGEWRAAADVLLGCDRYPFVVPVYLASIQALFGLGESVARYALASLWCFGLYALYFLVRQVVADRRRALLSIVFVAMLGANTPLAALYAPTLFLEGPFAAVMSFALLVWLRRGAESAGRARDMLAGALVALAFFTKFNYGVLLALGLALDAGVQFAGAWRKGEAAAIARSLAWVGVVPIVACAWWFVLPLPGGLDLGASHRTAFLSFLTGNQDFARVPWQVRAIDWTTLVFWRPLALFFCGMLLVSLAFWRRAAVRCLWIVTLVFVVSLCVHPFHLDRFLVPAMVPLWTLAIGGLLSLDRNRRRSWLHSSVTVLLALGVSVAVGFWWTGHALGVLGLADANPKIRAYQQQQLDDRNHIGPHTPLPTGGLLRKEADGFLGLAAEAAGPTARVGWLGLSSELSPAAIHLGLLERGGSGERFLRDAHREMDVTFEGVDPNWTKQQLAEFAAGFDVFFATDPPDLARRANRAFTVKYRRMLVDELGWSERELGTVEIEKALVRYPVRLFACRPPEH